MFEFKGKDELNLIGIFGIGIASYYIEYRDESYGVATTVHGYITGTCFILYGIYKFYLYQKKRS